MTNDIRYNSYDEVFGLPQPNFDEIAWKNEHPGFPYVKPEKHSELSFTLIDSPAVVPMTYAVTGSHLFIETDGNIGLASINPSFEFHVTTGNSELVKDANTTFNEAKIGFGMNDPNEKLHITEPLDVSKHFEKNIGMGINNPKAILDWIGIGGESPSKKLDITPILNKEDFTEELKALHYDLDRAKDVPTREKLIEEFTEREFEKVRNSCFDKKNAETFFIKTWDLTKKRKSSIDYCDYAEFLDEYFDESGYDDGGL